MDFNKFFFLIFFVCSFSGFLISLLINDFYMEGNLHQNVMDNFKNNETNNNRENEEKRKKK